MVLGMRSSEVGCTDFLLILDLKRVLIKVDFPKPLCPGDRMGASQRALWFSNTWALPPSTPQWGPQVGEVRRQEGLGGSGSGPAPMLPWSRTGPRGPKRS